MKRLCLLLTMLLLTACGSGGSTAGGNSTEVNAQTPTGTLHIAFAPEPDTARAVSKALTKKVRIVVTNPTLRFDGVLFKAIQDVAPGETVSFSLPLARSYTVEAITYTVDSDTGLNTILRYAVASGVTVGSSETGATLTLVDVAVQFLLPQDGVMQNARYYVQANLSTALGRRISPLQTGWYMLPPKISPFTGFVNKTSATNYSSTHFFSAPFTGTPGYNLYFQGVFTLKPGLLKTGESPKKWVFNYPNPSFANVSTPVLTPTNFTITTPIF